MPKFIITETTAGEEVNTVRLGTNTVANAGGYTDSDVGKAVKLAGESRFALCAAGDPIEGFINSVNLGVYDGYAIGGITDDEYKTVTLDGLQGTPGTGVVAIGDLVVCGTVVAAGTKLGATPVKVCKATSQAVGLFNWRVVSLGTAGTGAVGTTAVIERV